MGRLKYLSEQLFIKLDCLGSFIGGMLNAITSDFTENNNIKKQQKKFKDKLFIWFIRFLNRSIELLNKLQFLLLEDLYLIIFQKRF